MLMQDAPVYAAIDIGSNTLRMIVARVQHSHLDILATDEALVRIGESVNAESSISEEKQAQTIAVFRKYKAIADEHQAQTIIAVATEAIRRASNQEQFLIAIEQATGLDVSVIGGDIEGILTFYGAIYDVVQEQERVAVMDLGGGSTELILANDGDVYWLTSLTIGSGWLHDRYLVNDPPHKEEVSAAYTFLQTFFQGVHVKRFPGDLRVTGGSANTLLRFAQRAFGLPASSSVLTRDDLIRCEALLCTQTSEMIAQQYEIEMKRARILIAGVFIIRALLEQFGISQFVVSEYGIREGLLLAYARFGDQWREHVQQQAQQGSIEQVELADTIDYEHETFTQAGQRLLKERLQKMLDWRSDVVRNEDVEAVHKMRVASRRLRAALDAYEAICAPKPFRQLYRSVKKAADLLGQARDTDVMIENLQSRKKLASLEEQAGLEWLIERLKRYRQSHQKLLAAFLQGFDEEELHLLLKQCMEKGAKSHGES